MLPRYQAAGRPLHLHLDDTVANYTVPADADKLLSVLLNLLENALRHAPQAAAVQVALGPAPAGPGWQVAISNPVARSLGDLSRLTAAYYQADVLSEGAGLGLWLSSRILELHGSSLQLAESRGVFSAEFMLANIE
ncbi:ATP-binding protein [Hymenobacter canadensis]|uniref:ATP-binding protein n=1 Tax=Hymenobacter canadensis TaxID=2999067 RepID=UPI0033137C38